MVDATAYSLPRRSLLGIGGPYDDSPASVLSCLLCVPTQDTAGLLTGSLFHTVLESCFMFLELLWDGAKIELECYWNDPRDTYEMTEVTQVGARPVLLEIQSGEHSSHKV